ncbi:glycerophosphoryl diester phosphodiesterase [Rhodotorula diobovata]|uniref:Glycerophosphoryl diester phosphodiesterase n=1 Tax=Rhodotorula diobovata TaxID=5288 RepID=A0A5C5FSP1_9BASI|nr:glycerophosphoryl diester phosphodiesterase [Rhodotorula diobovata]
MSPAPKPTLERSPSSLDRVPLCWGHRGASAAFPENTLASFEAAIRDGAEGIESDVHISADGEILVFHDPRVDRTTDGTGRIATQNYHGGLDQLRTVQAPHQKIPLLRETLDLLMLPANQHVLLNIDVKVDNDPERLFAIMRDIIESYDGFETKLAPRLLLGLWHPKYVEPAQRLLPAVRRAHIGMSPALARKYFWDACCTFSMSFASMVNSEGQVFRDECRKAGKEITVWTVNDRREMIEATKWGVKAILTDRTKTLLELRHEMEQDWDKVARETSGLFGWTSFWYLGIANYLISSWEAYLLTKVGGAFYPVPPLPASSSPAPAVGPAVVAKVGA